MNTQFKLLVINLAIAQPVRVTVADGNYVLCTSHCKGFIWKMQGRSAHNSSWGSDIVLVNDWMKKHNLTKFNHERRYVTIGRKSNKLVLPG